MVYILKIDGIFVARSPTNDKIIVIPERDCLPLAAGEFFD
jgi:hypothetical protein